MTQVKIIFPGDVIRKNPVMTNESDQPWYIWQLKVDYSDAQGNLMSAEEFAKYAEVTDFNKTDWEKISTNSDGSEIWLHKSEVAAESKTNALFNNVKINTGISEEWSSKAKTTTVLSFPLYNL